MTQIVNVLQPDGSIQEIACEVQVGTIVNADGSDTQSIEIVMPASEPVAE